MRLLVLLFSAFVTALAAGGQAVRAAESAQVSAAAETVAEAVAPKRRAPVAIAYRPAPDWRLLNHGAFARVPAVPLYASRLRL